MKRNAQFLFLSIFAATLIVFPRPAHACRCDMPDTPAEAYSRVDAVFIGKVIFDAPDTDSPQSSYQIYTFDVMKSWKGVASTQVAVRTSKGGASCGYLFRLGHEYLVYAYSIDGEDTYWTSFCTSTKPVALMDEDLQYLKTLSTLPFKSSLDYVLIGSLLVGAGFLAMIISVVSFRRFRSKTRNA